MIHELNETLTVRIADGVTMQMPAMNVVRAAIQSIEAPAIITRRAVPRIGEHWDEEGGLYAGILHGNGGPDRQIITPADMLDGTFEWGGRGEDEPGAKCEFDGMANTRALLRSKVNHPAAQAATEFTDGRHHDYCLPARRELRLLHINLPQLKADVWTWSSTQHSPSHAWFQYFDDGYQLGGNKDLTGRVRVVRSRPI